MCIPLAHNHVPATVPSLQSCVGPCGETSDAENEFLIPVILDLVPDHSCVNDLLSRGSEVWMCECSSVLFTFLQEFKGHFANFCRGDSMNLVGECPESVNQWEIRPKAEYPWCRNMGHFAHNQICNHFIQPCLTVTRESCAVLNLFLSICFILRPL